MNRFATIVTTWDIYGVRWQSAASTPLWMNAASWRILVLRRIQSGVDAALCHRSPRGRLAPVRHFESYDTLAGMLQPLGLHDVPFGSDVPIRAAFDRFPDRAVGIEGRCFALEIRVG